MVSAADHITGLTGLHPTVTISKNGAGYITPSGIVTELANGMYSLAANEFDANTIGPLLLHATAPGADPRDDVFDVVVYNPARVFPISPPTHAQFGTVSAQDFLDRAFGDLGRAAGETMSADDYQDGFRRLNQMISQWAVQPLTMPVVVREIFDLNPLNTTGEYTIGPDGDWEATKPIFVRGAGLLMNSSTPPIEIPRVVLTDDMYQAIQIKDLTNTLWTDLYYNKTFTDGLGTVKLWPIPTDMTTQVVLYSQQAIQGFASLTAQYVFPPGYEEAIEYNLALRLALPYGLPIPPDLKWLAGNAMKLIKRANTPLTDLWVGPEFARDKRGGYNILTGQGG